MAGISLLLDATVTEPNTMRLTSHQAVTICRGSVFLIYYLFNIDTKGFFPYYLNKWDSCKNTQMYFLQVSMLDIVETIEVESF